MIIWKVYMDINYSETYKMDGKISDPRGDPGASRICPAGNDTLKNRTHEGYVQDGGCFKPRNCSTADLVVIIVPYRDREEHLKTFLDYIHPFLQQQKLQYAIYVVEMAMPTTFNRGLLANIGVLEAMNSGKGFSCYIIHDVDLLPADDRNLYICSDGPRHMSTSNSNYNFRIPYSGYVGGVISFTPTVYRNINGFSNVYFGWGGEDDDLTIRINQAGYTLQRVPEDIGIYSAMDHGTDQHNKENTDKYKLLSGARARMKTDGLNSAKYTLLKFEQRPLYTWIFVQVNQSDYKDIPEPPS